MDKVETGISMKTLAVSTAMAGALLSGCASQGAPRAEISASQAQEAMAEGRTDRAVRLAEQAVETEPRNASYRAMLGKAYLDAGRFASAQTSFDDAMALGDNSPRTALSLALALTAQAKYTEAAALLNDWEGQIATADLGLALALAGQPERGIHLMGNAIRAGENTPKMRQNLAYAYAVAGRWREARVMAAQDVPAGEVGARMEQWAAMSSPLAYQSRVARLLGVPAGVSDAGQPISLALANTPGVEQLASEASGQQAGSDVELAIADISSPASSIERVAIPASAGELPAVGRPSIAPEAQAAAPVEQPTRFAQAFATDAPAGGSLAQVAQDAVRFASEPAVQTAPIRYGATPEPRVAGSAMRQQQVQDAQAGSPSPRYVTPSNNSSAQDAPMVAPARREAPSNNADSGPSGSSHLVQLGSFSSEQGARRAWGIYVSRYPELANHEMVITEAMVNGRRYFRVSAGGFNQVASRSMCRRVDAAGGDGCISWAAASPLPGALPSRADNGVRLARRD